MFVFLMLFLIVGLFVYAYSCCIRLMKFYGADTNKKGLKAVSLIVAFTITAQCMTLWTTGAVVTLHFVAAFLIFDSIAFVVQKLHGKREEGKKYLLWQRVYQCGIVPFLLVLILFGYGYFNMNHIQKMQYQVETKKQVEDYRIALLTDIHYDTVQNSKVLKKKLQEINEQHPDFVILGGDIVEEGTSKTKMQEIFRILGGMENKYGIYFVYGNHDKQPYTSNRTFSDEELKQAITDNGIVILEDNYVEIGEDLILAGREDATMTGESNRLSSETILQGADREKYIIMVDHQPIAAEENDAQGVDLELSGHTHGGQIWPTGPLSELVGVLNYGEYQKGNCKVIVSSGIAGWTYAIRTGKHCEYVIVDLKKA